jgi:hypothetical protein
MSLSFHTGNVLYPEGPGRKIVAHICIKAGAWGGGFTAPLIRRWPQAKTAYNSLRVKDLGHVQFVNVEDGIQVANMIGQVCHRNRGPSINYYAVRMALRKVARMARLRENSVHIRRIGCGLAGGSWHKIEEIIFSKLVAVEIHVYVYNCTCFYV